MSLVLSYFLRLQKMGKNLIFHSNLHNFMVSTSISEISKSKNKTCRAQTKDLLNPSKEARMISPGKRLKNFCPTLELTIEFVKNPDTLTTPERIPVATFSDLLVNFLTLKFANTI